VSGLAHRWKQRGKRRERAHGLGLASAQCGKGREETGHGRGPEGGREGERARGAFPIYAMHFYFLEFKPGTFEWISNGI
jgi:hypothetical protein